jgi:hypothetical protein
VQALDEPAKQHYYLGYLPITIRARVNGVPLWVLQLYMRGAGESER